ncbi:Uncharacterised protein [Segatella copri]|nr:Uncharacterised protein [Segatella copri]
MIETIGILRIIRIESIHICRRTFYFSKAHAQFQVLVGVEIVSSHQETGRLHVAKHISVKVAFIGHYSHTGAYLHAILRIVLCTNRHTAQS